MVRAYDSPRRTEQRLATRKAVLAAAAAAFAAHGYHGTTIRSIADHAAVSPETIYATFGSKLNVLREVVRDASIGDSPTMLDQDWFDAVLNESDQRRRWEHMRAGTATVLRKARPLDAIVRAAAASDPDVAALWNEMEGERHANVERLVRLLADAGPLRVSIDDAVDLMWGLSRSTGIYESLTVDRGWPDDKAFNAISNAIAHAIFPEPGPRTA